MGIFIKVTMDFTLPRICFNGSALFFHILDIHTQLPHLNRTAIMLIQCIVDNCQKVIKSNTSYLSCAFLLVGIFPHPSFVTDSEIIEYGFIIILCREAGVGQIAIHTPPFTQATVVEHLQIVGDDEWHDTSPETFLKHQEPPYPSVAILKGMYTSRTAHGRSRISSNVCCN